MNPSSNFFFVFENVMYKMFENYHLKHLSVKFSKGFVFMINNKVESNAVYPFTFIK